HGVFMLTKEQLTSHQNSFTQAFEQK
ncbi:MAG: hypothetical protein ACJA0T_001383, partial [Colwellia sp.]